MKALEPAEFEHAVATLLEDIGYRKKSVTKHHIELWVREELGHILAKHRKRAHEIWELWKCSDCGSRLRLTKEKPYKFYCPICERT